MVTVAHCVPRLLILHIPSKQRKCLSNGRLFLRSQRIRPGIMYDSFRHLTCMITVPRNLHVRPITLNSFNPFDKPFPLCVCLSSFKREPTISQSATTLPLSLYIILIACSSSLPPPQLNFIHHGTSIKSREHQLPRDVMFVLVGGPGCSNVFFELKVERDLRFHVEHLICCRQRWKRVGHQNVSDTVGCPYTHTHRHTHPATLTHTRGTVRSNIL